jgi:DNA helicase TIP49 (TBP-interacting protein)
VSAKAMAKLCEVSETSSLRYTIQLLSPAKLLAAIAGRETVEVCFVLKNK